MNDTNSTNGDIEVINSSQDKRGESFIKSSIPLKQPEPFTLMQYEAYKYFPEQFYSVCHCLEWVDGEHVTGQAPLNTINLKASPLLTGKRPITSREELLMISKDLLSKPIFTRVNYEYEIQAKGAKFYLDHQLRTNDKFAVIIDTRHPLIHAALKSYLDEASRLFEAGEEFCMEISFSQCLREVIAMHYEPENHFFGAGSHVYSGMAIFITNSSMRKCKMFTSKRFMAWCFLCWIFTGPCYLAYRKFVVKDYVRTFPELNAKYLSNNELLYIKTATRPMNS